jgi:hypothetical protein
MDTSYALLVNCLFDRVLVDKEISADAERRIIHAVHESLKNLDERRSDIVIRRFGLGQKKEKLREVGALYGITGSRIRTVENDAFYALRRNTAGFPLRAVLFEEGFLDESSGIFDPRFLSKALLKVTAGETLTDEELERIPVDQIGFSARTRHGLRNDNIDTLLQLKSQTERQIMRVPHLGKRSLGEILEKLTLFGCTLASSDY